MLRPLVVATVLFTGAAQAVAATDVDDVIAILAELGHSTVEDNRDGTTIYVDERSWYVGLECAGRVDCEYAWVHARREVEEPVYAECANTWNGREAFTTAWIDDLSQPWLKKTIDFGGDIAPAAIRSQLERFTSQLTKFEAYVLTCPAIEKDW